MMRVFGAQSHKGAQLCESRRVNNCVDSSKDSAGLVTCCYEPVNRRVMTVLLVPRATTDDGRVSAHANG